MNDAYAVPDGDRMGKIAGYRKMSEDELKVFQQIKEAEERTIRFIEALEAMEDFDKRWLAIGKTHVQQGTMAILRAVARPGRISLPEDNMGNAAVTTPGGG